MNVNPMQLGGRTILVTGASSGLGRGIADLLARLGAKVVLVARDAARPDSDVDVLVAFDGPATSTRYFGVQFFLEDLLGCPVELVTEKALRPELRHDIEREAVRI